MGSAELRARAMAYVARYATTSHKLTIYLRRKAREADANNLLDEIPTLVEQMRAAGFVDDTAFARNRSDSLARRGYGPARIRVALSDAGIDKLEIEETATNLDELGAARKFAHRKRLGPAYGKSMDAKDYRRAMAAMHRAGHRYAVAKMILDQLLEEGDKDDWPAPD